MQYTTKNTQALILKLFDDHFFNHCIRGEKREINITTNYKDRRKTHIQIWCFMTTYFINVTGNLSIIPLDVYQKYTMWNPAVEDNPYNKVSGRVSLIVRTRDIFEEIINSFRPREIEDIVFYLENGNSETLISYLKNQKIITSEGGKRIESGHDSIKELVQLYTIVRRLRPKLRAEAEYARMRIDARERFHPKKLEQEGYFNNLDFGKKRCTVGKDIKYLKSL